MTNRAANDDDSVARKMKLEEMARSAAEAIATLASVGAKPVSAHVFRVEHERERESAERYAV